MAQSEFQRLAREVHTLKRNIAGLSTPQLTHSSIEDGSVNEYDAAGALVGVVGKQFDGTHGAVAFQGPRPPTPSDPVAVGGPGTLSVEWDGGFAAGAARPLDLHFVRATAVEVGGGSFTLGSLVAAGALASYLPAGTYEVTLSAESMPGLTSRYPSGPVTAVVSDYVDTTAITTELDAANTRIAEAKTTLDQLRGETPMPVSLGEALAAGTQGYLSLAVTQLSVGEGSMSVGVIDKLFADVVKARMSVAEAFIGENAILENSITAPKIVASEELTAKFAQFLKVSADEVDVDSLWADTAWISKANAQVLTLLSNTDGSGYTSEHTAEGLRIYYTDPETGEKQDRITLGTFPGAENYLGFTDDNNDPSVSIDKDGNGSFRKLDVGGSLMLAGSDLNDRINMLPQGMIAWGQVPVTSNMSSNGEVGLFELGWESAAESPGRMYRFDMNPVVLDCTAANGIVGFTVRITTDGSAPTISSPLLATSYASGNGGRLTLGISRIIGSSNGPYIRLLVSLVDTSSGVVSVSTSNNQSHIYSTVTELGPSIPHTASPTTGGGTPWTGATVAPPTTPKVQRTVTYGHTGVRSYLGNNNTYAYQTNKGFQGLQPNTSNGILKSIWTFPSVTSLLSGAEINDIWAEFYFEHWYYPTGVARIRMHNNLGLPGVYNGTGFGMDSGEWARASRQWVRVPDSLYAGWKSGAYRGFALEGYNTIRSYGVATSAKLRIRYTK